MKRSHEKCLRRFRVATRPWFDFLFWIIDRDRSHHSQCRLVEPREVYSFGLPLPHADWLIWFESCLDWFESGRICALKNGMRKMIDIISVHWLLCVAVSHEIPWKYPFSGKVNSMGVLLLKWVQNPKYVFPIALGSIIHHKDMAYCNSSNHGIVSLRLTQ